MALSMPVSVPIFALPAFYQGKSPNLLHKAFSYAFILK